MKEAGAFCVFCDEESGKHSLAVGCKVGLVSVEGVTVVVGDGGVDSGAVFLFDGFDDGVDQGVELFAVGHDEVVEGQAEDGDRKREEPVPGFEFFRPDAAEGEYAEEYDHRGAKQGPGLFEEVEHFFCHRGPGAACGRNQIRSTIRRNDGGRESETISKS